MTGGPIFCMGGGGFTMEPGRPALDAYVLALAPVARPRVLFLPTASGDPRDQVEKFSRLFGSWPCRPRVLSLFDLGGLEESLETLILGQDVIYVGGGSMRNLLALWRAHGVDELLLEAHRRGTVLAGLSAGAMCWFRGGVSCSTGAPEPIDGLGLLEGSFSVHAKQVPERARVQHEAIASGRLPDGWNADDWCGLLFVDGRLEEAVASRAGAGARRIERGPDGAVIETALPVRMLEPVTSELVADVAERRTGRTYAPLDVRDELRAVRRIRERALASRGRRAG
ncbi:Type 1 glutamine amidotransferase-like domain-containing protein [Patulibacter defluvii]|uniref:Type 1 glutamine amidotransferase-like domain-containing protein n=1 Tax=Patulibacter defluvii TaxID=3095358 RepID=UPI002A7666C0|nr:peptidase E [Patulibacter sp. DM4]